jgi:hypothetical protein
VVGFALAPLQRQGRALYAVLALMVVLPPEAFTGAIGVNLVGVTLAVALLARDHVRRRSADTPIPDLTQEKV